MKYFFDHQHKIFTHAPKTLGWLVMLDFDGTLSKIEKVPAAAKLYKKAEKYLLPLASKKNCRVAVVSGRELKDLKSKVRGRKLIYAGNHGLEWEADGRSFYRTLPYSYAKVLPGLKKSLNRLTKHYQGSLTEIKGATIALHYRQVKSSSLKNFKIEAEKILKPYDRKKIINVIHGKKVFDIRPHAGWNKGDFALFLKKTLGRGKACIYIGDDATDEDAFKALSNSLTIRVGHKQKSYAKYYLKDFREVPKVLKILLG